MTREGSKTAKGGNDTSYRQTDKGGKNDNIVPWKRYLGREQTMPSLWKEGATINIDETKEG